MQSSIILRKLPGVRYTLVRAFATGTSTNPPTTSPGGSSASTSPPASRTNPAKPDAQTTTPGSHDADSKLPEEHGKSPKSPGLQKPEGKTGKQDPPEDVDVHNM